MQGKRETDDADSECGPRDANFVRSLERGLEVIRVLSAPGPGMTLSEVAEATGLSRAAARRFLLTLQRLSYVKLDRRHFSLTPRVLTLGYAYLSSLSLPDIARPHLERLARQVNESCSMSVLDGDEIVYVARVAAAQRVMSITIQVGTHLPAYPTSMGRVLLADLTPEELDGFLERVELRRLTASTVVDADELRTELERVRRQGWAIVDEEREEGLRAAAAPIRDASRRVVAAVNLSVLAGRTSLSTLRRTLLPALLDTAAAIESDLSANAPQPRQRFSGA